MGKGSRNQQRLRRHARIRKKMRGTPEMPRLNVYRSLNQIYAQVIDDQHGRTIVATSTLDPDLKSKLKGLSKTEQAKLVGKKVAKVALSEGVKRVRFDRGGYRYHGRVKALAESARQAGLEF